MFAKQAPSCKIEQRKGVWEDVHSSSVIIQWIAGFVLLTFIHWLDSDLSGG